MLADGMQFGWVSPSVPKLLASDSPIPITKEEGGWITQYYIIGNLCGVIVSVNIFNKLSKKWSIALATVPIVLGWVGILIARSVVAIYVSRFLAGVGRNMVYVVVPMYIGEIADPKIRGMLGTFIYLMMNLGVLISYLLIPFTPFYVASVVGLCIAGAKLLLLKFLPESPYYLLAHGKKEAAEEALITLRGTKDVSEEVNRIEEAVKKQTTQKPSLIKSYRSLFTVRSNIKALLILLLLRSIQILSGVSVLTMHIHAIFAEAGGKLKPEHSALVYIFMQITSSFVTLGVMDRFGRKPLMIFSCIISCVAMTLAGTYFYLKTTTNLASFTWIPLLTTLMFVYGYRVGLGTVPIVMVGELFPANVKVSGVVLTDLMYSLSNFASNAIFHSTEAKFGMFAPFFFYGVFSLAGAIFSILFVPETKGKNLEEIQMLLSRKKSLKDDNKAEGIDIGFFKEKENAIA